MGKTKVLFLVAVLSIFILCGISYAMASYINAAGPAAADTPAADAVAKRVIEEGKKAPSNSNLTPVKETMSADDETIASGQTLVAAKPALFNEDMVGTITLPATLLAQLGNDKIVELANYINNGADGKNVIILGENEDQVDAIRARLTQAGLILDGVELERLFFAMTNSNTLSAVEELFTRNQGAFALCRGDRLAPNVREALKGAI